MCVIATLQVMLRLALKLMRSSVKRKAGCDITSVSPLDVVGKSLIPAMFGHGEEDSFISIQHSGGQLQGGCLHCQLLRRCSVFTTMQILLISQPGPRRVYLVVVCFVGPAEKLHAAYNSTAPHPVYKNLVRFKGDHNHPRPAFFYSSVCCFFHQQLGLDQVLLEGMQVRYNSMPSHTVQQYC